MALLKKSILVICSFIPIIFGYFYNDLRQLIIVIPEKIPGLSAAASVWLHSIVYIMCLILLALWFYLGCHYAHVGWNPIAAIIAAHAVGIVLLGSDIWTGLKTSWGQPAVESVTLSDIYFFNAHLMLSRDIISPLIGKRDDIVYAYGLSDAHAAVSDGVTDRIIWVIIMILTFILAYIWEYCKKKSCSPQCELVWK